MLMRLCCGGRGGRKGGGEGFKFLLWGWSFDCISRGRIYKLIQNEIKVASREWREFYTSSRVTELYPRKSVTRPKVVILWWWLVDLYRECLTVWVTLFFGRRSTQFGHFVFSFCRFPFFHYPVVDFSLHHQLPASSINTLARMTIHKAGKWKSYGAKEKKLGTVNLYRRVRYARNASSGAAQCLTYLVAMPPPPISLS